MRVLNNKGFTLVEVLAVLVILVAIAAIAIPTITSSMERTKEKQNDAKKEMLASYAEEYVEDNKNEIYNNLGTSNECYIELDELTEKGYIKNGTELDVDGNEFKGYIIFDKSNNSYIYRNNSNEIDGIPPCDSNEQTNIESTQKFLNNQNPGSYVNYKGSAEWRIAYNKEGSAHLVSATTVGYSQTLSAIYRMISSGYCDNNYTYNGLCNEESIWPMGPNDFEGITGYKIDDSLCYGSSAIVNCKLDDDLIKIGSSYYFIGNNNTDIYVFKSHYLEKTEFGTYNFGVRIVIKMNPDILVISGDGSKESPYLIAKTD